MYLDTKDLLTPLAFSFPCHWEGASCTFSTAGRQIPKLGGIAFSLKLSTNFGVLLVVNEMLGWIVRGIKEVQIFLHIQIHVVCTNIIAQTVCVCEKKSGSFTIFLDNVVIMEFIHVEFGDI